MFLRHGIASKVMRSVSSRYQFWRCSSKNIYIYFFSCLFFTIFLFLNIFHFISLIIFMQKGRRIIKLFDGYAPALQNIFPEISFDASLLNISMYSHPLHHVSSALTYPTISQHAYHSTRPDILPSTYPHPCMSSSLTCRTTLILSYLIAPHCTIAQYMCGCK